MRIILFCIIYFCSIFYPFLYAQSPVKEGSRLEKLKENINSNAHEAHPWVSPDGKTLFFSRWKHEGNIGGIKAGSDIWMATQDTSGNWIEPLNIGSPLNNIGNNYISSILPDGNTILLPNLYTHAGEPSNTPGISISKKTSSGWSIPQKQEIEYYTNKSDQADFFLSSDGKVMVMAIEYFFTYGNEDLHVSFKKDDGSWSQPKNLGAEINTKGHELSPFLAADGVTLYFSSNGHKGYGSKDIFVARRLDDSWSKWSKPVNLGTSINTAGMETSFVIPAGGEYAYLVSSKNSDSHSDIYRVPVPKEAKPEAVVLVKGKVFNSKTKKPIQAEIRYELLPEGKNVGTATSDPFTGSYTIILPGGGNNYAYYAQAKDFLSVNENFDAAELTNYKEINRDLYLVPIEIGESITLNNIFFEKSTPKILEESYPELDRIAKILKDNPAIEIEIGGHTDNTGKQELNVALSEKRVGKVKDYLVSKGINAERIKGKGYGGSNPIAPNNSEENKKKNRRVEFKIIKK